MGSPVPNLGKHHLRRDEDLVFFVWNGDLFPEQVAEILRCIEQAQEDHGFVYVLVDTRAAGRLGPEARKVAADWRMAGDFPAIAMFGASFATRVVVNMLPSAYALLAGKPAMQAHYCETEAEARAWLLAQRRAREQSGR